MNDSWKSPIDLAMNMLEKEDERKRKKLVSIIASLISDLLLRPLAATLLWNLVMPDIFSLPELTFWQAWLLIMLIRFAK